MESWVVGARACLPSARKARSTSGVLKVTKVLPTAGVISRQPRRAICANELNESYAHTCRLLPWHPARFLATRVVWFHTRETTAEGMTARRATNLR